jgi:hypothetical protein
MTMNLLSQKKKEKDLKRPWNSSFEGCHWVGRDEVDLEYKTEGWEQLRGLRTSLQS